MRGHSLAARRPARPRLPDRPDPRWFLPALLFSFSLHVLIPPVAFAGQEEAPGAAPPVAVEDEEAPPSQEGRASEARPGAKKDAAGKSADDGGDDAARLFHARQILARLGIRHLSPEGGTPGPAVAYRGQITAPALAFLGGLGDPGGAMPLFRSPVYVTLEGPGRILFFVDIAGEIRGPGGQKTGVIVHDASRLPGAVQIVRRGW